ncbi:hypothetical protein HHK36_005517 [Tetracentron sinense]|uniref:Uncharacterized protein n=1 Tax=Tetracentron sinense TaxID=13715 RepID=A0A835DMW5_TETSI|nr:hypothetical protein HHK36_005517 [Tetracentron sinense]
MNRIPEKVLMVQAMADGPDQGLDRNGQEVGTGHESHLVVGMADPTTISAASPEDEQKPETAEAPDIRRMGKHHSSGKSVAGGGVIIGGLFTTIFAAVFCYIRVTRRRRGDSLAPSL